MEENTKTYFTYKDRLFRMIFKEKEALLELYNAMNETDYDRTEDLVVTTLENAIYLSMKNDVSFVLYDQLTLYEQQSTRNPNMPLRDLFYVSNTYSTLVRDKNIYSSKLIPLPEPKFVTFYNGRETLPERCVLKLSDSYQCRTGHPELELEVLVLNINPGFNENLMAHCKTLHDYMVFVDKVRIYHKEAPLTSAIERAIDECIQEGVLADFLRKNRAEVRNVCIFEYDEERHIQMEREEAMLEGEARGEARGETRGEARGKKLGSIQTLIEIYESLDFPEEKILAALMEKYALNDIKAKEALQKFTTR